jgi:phosphate transport system ATP-binding protein
LAVKPDVILMDEPCLGPRSHRYRAHRGAHPRALRRDYTIVIVTHNDAARPSGSPIARRSSYMGELIELAETATLFARPGDPRTADYIAGRFG